MSRKTKKADLRKSYPIYVELGLIAALGILILAFRIDLRSQEPEMAVVEEQEEIQMEEVQQTEQVEQSPPPPKPPVPVEVPNEEELEDQDIDFDAALDLNEDLSSDEPPPPPDEEEEEEPEQEVFVAVEDQPKMLPDQQTAMRELQECAEYPEMAIRAGVEGRVYVQFVVSEQGQVTNPEILKGKGAGLDEEALRCVTETLRFEPGKQRGNPVKVRMSVPVNFTLN